MTVELPRLEIAVGAGSAPIRMDDGDAQPRTRRRQLWAGWLSVRATKPLRLMPGSSLKVISRSAKSLSESGIEATLRATRASCRGGCIRTATSTSRSRG